MVGPERPEPLQLPPALSGQLNLGFTQYRTYSIFLIVVGFLIGFGIWLVFERTRIGAQIRATVDNRRMAELLGINVDRLFTITFAFGSGMAAIGGGLGAEFLGLDPQYPLKYLVYFLIVVSVGGLGSVIGVYYAALLLGVLDFVLKLYLPKGGTIFIYALTILHPAVCGRRACSEGKSRERRGRSSTTAAVTRIDNPAARALIRRHRLRWWEALPWIAAASFYFAFPGLSRLRRRTR